jgi:ATP/maltotriose-dependent transcriptional regulator MalT
MPDISAALARGTAALREGRWTLARTQFELALRGGDDGPALEGLSDALWWLDEVEAAVQARERAYAWFRERKEAKRAVHIAVWLARESFAAFGDRAVASGWLSRAKTLATKAGPCAEAAWIELLKAKMAGDCREARAHASRAAEIARKFGDIDLQMLALSEIGRALVTAGEFVDGMRKLDEAAAAATSGEVKSLVVIGDTCCNMISACERAFDFDRLRQWSRVVDDFCQRHHCIPILSFCHIVAGGARIATGDWSEAEKELSSAARIVMKGHPPMRVQATAKLALLRVRQGRLEDARRLLRGNESHSATSQAVASLHLADGDAATAAGVAEEAIRALAEEDVRAVPLLDLAIEARLARGEIDAARSHLAQLQRIAVRSRRKAIEACAVRASARIDGDDPSPQRAAELFTDAGLPFDAAVARFERALRVKATQPEIAELEARAALDTFDDLGAALYADRAAELLRSLGRRARRTPRIAGLLTQREQDVLRLLAGGLSNPAIASRLRISAKTVEHHVSHIFAKLGVRNRVEAAALAPR